MYFKAFQLPRRKEATDIEIGKKQQVTLWIFKRKSINAVTMSTSTPPVKITRWLFINRNKKQPKSNSVPLIMIKSTSTFHYLLIKNVIK